MFWLITSIKTFFIFLNDSDNSNYQYDYIFYHKDEKSNNSIEFDRK